MRIKMMYFNRTLNIIIIIILIISNKLYIYIITSFYTSTIWSVFDLKNINFYIKCQNLVHTTSFVIRIFAVLSVVFHVKLRE